MSLQDYDMIPYDMRAYLRNNGRHFNKKACDYAVRNMMKYNASTRQLERIDAMTKEQVDELLMNNGVTLDNARGYDYVYVANMCKADFFMSSIADEAHLAMYVKDVIDDPDAPAGSVFNRWLADMDSKGEPIEWKEML